MPFTRPASILLLCASAGCVQTEVSYFRQHGGVANNDTQPLPERFDAGDQLLWRQELAPGHSTPCVFGSHIFVTTYEDEKLATVALSRGTGKPLWARVAPGRVRRQQLADPPRRQGDLEPGPRRRKFPSGPR